MNKIAVVIIGLLMASSAMAITPSERSALKKVQTELRLARDEGVILKQKQAEAEQHAATADQHAAETDQRADVLQKQVDVSHDNEQKLANRVAPLQAFWDGGHKLWGLGAIGLGIGILTRHLLILLAILVVGAILVWIASMFFPVIGVGLKAVMAFIKALLARISSLFKKKT